MTSLRKIAIAAGVCYLITHVTSVPALILYAPILNRADYVLGSGPDTRVLLGAFLEVICAFAIGAGAVLGFVVAWVLRLWMATLRYRYQAVGPNVEPTQGCSERYI